MRSLLFVLLILASSCGTQERRPQAVAQGPRRVRVPKERRSRPRARRPRPAAAPEPVTPEPVTPEPVTGKPVARNPAAGEAVTAGAATGKAHGRVSLLMGARRLGDEAWSAVDEQLTLGIEFARILPSGFGIEFGALGSTELDEAMADNVDVTGALVELYFGFRQEFGSHRFHPYLGAGGTAIAAAIDNDSGGGVADDEDMTPAFYGRAGFLYDLSPSTFLGVDLRVVAGSSLDFNTIEADADYEQATFVLGLRF